MNEEPQLLPPLACVSSWSTSSRPSPKRPLTSKAANFTGLYRHARSGRYYACKKLGGIRRERSLGTCDRKIAERRLKKWIGNLDKVDFEEEKTTFGQLLQRFNKSTRGASESTRTNDPAGVDRKFIAEWQRHRDGGKFILDTYTQVFGGDDEEYVRGQLAKIGSGTVPVVPPSGLGVDRSFSGAMKKGPQRSHAPVDRHPAHPAPAPVNPYAKGDKVRTKLAGKG